MYNNEVSCLRWRTRIDEDHQPERHHDLAATIILQPTAFSLRASRARPATTMKPLNPFAKSEIQKAFCRNVTPPVWAVDRKSTHKPSARNISRGIPVENRPANHAPSAQLRMDPDRPSLMNREQPIPAKQIPTAGTSPPSRRAS